MKIDSGECIWEFAQKMRSSDMGLIRISLDFPIVWAFPASLFREGGVLANFQAFINVYKHYGPTAVDLDPRSKIQDYRKNFLDPRSGSKIQDPRFQEKLLGSTAEPSLGSGKALSSDPRSFFWNLGSWIQTLDPRSFFCNLGSWILDPDLGSKKFFL